MDAMKTVYCDKCGQISIMIIPFTGDQTICAVCNTKLKPIPSEYFEDDPLLLSEEMEQKLREDLVLTSPNFDQYYYDHREEIISQRDSENSAQWERIKAGAEERNRVPRCPSCGSTNISRIGIVSRALSTHLLGLASSKIGKTHECNNCGTTW